MTRDDRRTDEMTTASRMQQLLDATANFFKNETPAQVDDHDEPAFVAAMQNAKAPAWDPHDVWLNRVHKPREERSAD